MALTGRKKPPAAKPAIATPAFSAPGLSPAQAPVAQTGSGDLWGHASLYLVVASFALFAAWQKLFQYPLSARVIVPGLGDLDIGLWAALIHGIGGWLSLSVIVSLEQPGRLVRNLFRPLYAIDDEYIRRIFRNPLTLLFSLSIFAVTFSVVVSNVSIGLTSQYEILACLPDGHGRGELLQSDGPGESVRLDRETPARLLLRGWNAREIVVIRDRYNLGTIEAVEIQRIWRGFRFSHVGLRVDGESVAMQSDEAVSLEKTSPFHLSIRGTLSYGRRAVLWAVVGDADFSPGLLFIGEPEDGPEDPPNADATTALFFKDLWTSRSLFAHWPSGHQPHLGDHGITLHHPTSDYNNRILFKVGELRWYDGERTARTKEAILVMSKRVELPPTEKLLAAMAAKIGPDDKVIGLSQPLQARRR